ncbi:MAG: hypothetical protein CFE35_03395 [Novosphingobium sp. PASSN1]|nr:MAG: hypothetical protein CFE35_03395 [Novosphingobium sp. PASSN1]
MKLASALINFIAPSATKTRFDGICQISGRTRTSVLVELMNDFILSQADLLTHRSRQFDLIDTALMLNENVTDDGPLDLLGPSDDGDW